MVELNNRVPSQWVYPSPTNFTPFTIGHSQTRPRKVSCIFHVRQLNFLPNKIWERRQGELPAACVSLKSYLACSNVISLVQPATTIVVQTLICLNVYMKEIEGKGKNKYHIILGRHSAVRKRGLTYLRSNK